MTVPNPCCSFISSIVPLAGPLSFIWSVFSRYFWARPVSIMMSSGIPSAVLALTGIMAACLV